MAAFKPHYSLCPLLGPHNLVGISADKEENTVLITLGPNIIVKQRVRYFFVCFVYISPVQTVTRFLF